MMLKVSFEVVRRRYVELLRVARPAWIFLGILMLVWVSTCLLHEFRILTTRCEKLSAMGAMLQVIGLSLTLWSLQKRPELVRDKTVLQRARSWVKRFFTDWAKPPTEHQLSASAGASFSFGANMTHAGELTPEQRLAALEDTLRTELPAMRARIDSVEQSLAAQKADTEAALQRAGETVRKVTVGDISMEVAGALLVLTGLALSAIPQIYPPMCTFVLPLWFTI